MPVSVRKPLMKDDNPELSASSFLETLSEVSDTCLFVTCVTGFKALLTDTDDTVTKHKYSVNTLDCFFMIFNLFNSATFCIVKPSPFDG